MEKLGDFIRNKRLQMGVGLNRAAKIIGISASNLHDIETGKKTRPKIDTLNSIASFLGVHPDTIIILAEKIPPDVYWRMAKNPELIEMVRNYKQGN